MRAILHSVWERLSVPWRMACVVVLAITVTALCALFLSARFAASYAEVELQERLDNELESLSLAVGSAMVVNRREAVEPILKSYAWMPDVVQAGYRGSFGMLTAKDEIPALPKVPDWFVRWHGLGDRAASRPLAGGGEVFLELRATQAIERAWERVVHSMLLAGLGLAIAFCGGWLVIRNGLHSIRILINAGLALAGGNFSYRFVPGGSPEFRRVMTTFNTVSANLERLVGEARLREANLDTTLRSIGDAVLVTDAAGRVTLMNPVAELLTGWAESDARDRPVAQVFRIINQHTRQVVESPVDIVLREGKVVGLANHTVLIARDGVERPIADSGAPIRSHPDGAVEGVVLVFRDQSEEYRMTEALRASEELYASLVRSAPMGISRLDRKGDVVYCSETMAAMVGVPSGDFDREHWHRSIQADDIERFIAGWRDARRNGTEFAMTVRHAQPERGIVWVNTRFAPLRDATGQVVGFVGTAVDVTAEREAQRQIEDLSSLYSTLSSVNSAIVHCRDEAALYAEVCRAAVTQGGFSQTWIALADWQSQGIEIAGFCGMLEHAVRKTVAAIRLDAQAKYPALVVGALCSGESQVANDIQTDPRVAPHWREMCRERGICSGAAIPIRRSGKVVAALALLSSHRDFFSADIIALADEIGRDLSFALENFEREFQRTIAAENLEQSEERLRLTLDSVGIGMKEFNLRTQKYWLDANAARIVGIGTEPVEIDLERYLAITFPEMSKAEGTQIAEDVYAGRRQPYTSERSFVRTDGSVCWIRTQGGPIVTRRGAGDDPISLSIIMDVTAQHEQTERERMAMEKLAIHEERLRLALSVTGIGLKEVNLRTRRVWLDATAAQIIGAGDREIEMEMERYVALTYPGATIEEINQLGKKLEIGKQKGYAFEREFIRPDGVTRWLRTRGGSAVTCSSSGEEIVLSVMADVTEQHEQAERERLAMAMFTSSHEAIAITDADANIIMVNRAFCEQTGYSPDDVLGANPRILKSGRHDETFYRDLWDALQSDDHWQGEIWNRRKDGDIFPALVNISAVRNSEGRITHYVDQSTDISLQKQFEERITYLAYRDSLTDLPNRVLLRDRVEQALATALREEASLALLFLDLDHFKNINDSLGHVVGDRLLKEVAQRLSASVREMDTVGRLGGDEFLVMLPAADAEAAAHVAQKLVDHISQPFSFDGNALMVTPSIGIAMFPRDGESFDELLKTADTAMYRSKGEGRSTYRFFTPEMNEVVSQRLVMESSLRRAVEAREFVLFFQPQYDIDGLSLIGAEALIRWREPTLGFVSPGQFIPIAEESNLIEAIGAWVLEESCRQVRAWIDQGHPLLRVSVNFSARQFAAKGVLENFDRVLACHGLGGEALEVEITESLLAGDMDYTLRVLTALRERGVHVAVDDFGTGYSSLSYLKRFPINRLKIDQSFVRDIESDADDRAIATAVVTLGHSLGMQVIAEGVESQEQLNILAQMGCDEAQGYHLGRPMPAEDFTALLRENA